MTIDRKVLAVTLVLFGAMTAVARADDLAAQPGQCFRSGLMSVSCAPAAPRYFNRADRDQTRSVRSRHRE
jgi:hypothetical protein